MAQTKLPGTFRVNPPVTTPSPAPRRRSRRSIRQALPLVISWLVLVILVEMLVLLLPTGENIHAVSEAQVLPLPTPGVSQPPPTASYRLVIPPLPPTVTPLPPVPTPVPGQTLDSLIKSNADKLKESMGKDAEFALIIHNLDTGEKAAINPQGLFKTASLYKLFVMLTVYNDISQGKMSLDDNLTLTQEIANYSIDDDGGVLIVPVGGTMTVRDLMYAMIVNSNNAAALMLLFQVRTAHMRQLVADFGFKGADLTDSFNFRATAEDFDLYFSRLADQKLLGPKYDPAMLELLEKQPVHNRIPAFLPPGTRVATKIGDQTGISQDAGLVFLPNGQRLAVSFLVRQADVTEARKFVGQLTLLAYNYFVKG